MKTIFRFAVGAALAATAAGSSVGQPIRVAALVGALLLARALDDRDLSDEILDRAARPLHGYPADAKDV